MKLGVLISGTGRTLKNLIEKIRAGELDASIEIVISSRPGVPGIGIARAAGLPVEVVERRHFKDDAAFSDEIARRLEPFRVDVVVLAGFLHRWLFPARYEGRVVNIHPSLLPRFGGRGFYGERVHRAVLEAGESESGCTVHLADHEYDHGPILLQRRVPVRPGDTPESLAARVFACECETLPEALRKLGREICGKGA